MNGELERGRRRVGENHPYGIGAREREYLRDGLQNQVMMREWGNLIVFAPEKEGRCLVGTYSSLNTYRVYDLATYMYLFMVLFVL